MEYTPVGYIFCFFNQDLRKRPVAKQSFAGTGRFKKIATATICVLPYG